ncbi:methionine biosynthesis protein MetW [Patescibacteria group bacterium]|nr:methionine biosynthesis protein MetW [Patescibacteria group bacterium]
MNHLNRKFKSVDKIINKNIFQKIIFIIRKIFDLDIFDLVNDYEEYHKFISTNSIYRAKIISSWIPTGKKILDLGCGSGFIAAYLKINNNASVTGIDISKTAIIKARKKGINCMQMNLNEKIKLKEKYDYIILSEVIEHLMQPEKVLKQIRKYAKKGIIITIPNSAWFVYRLQLLMGHFPRQSWTHTHFWSHSDFKRFCKYVNLEIINFKIIKPREWLLKKIMVLWPNMFSPQLCYLLTPKKLIEEK